MAKKRKPYYPLPWADETSKEFRLRVCLWLLDRNGPMSYEQLVAVFNDTYADERKSTGDRHTFETTKESITRSMKTLHRRELVEPIPAEDRRNRIWQRVAAA